MATEAIIADVGILYKRLFNHRPIIQNEVNYFVKEFEMKGELKLLQDALSKSDEINDVFLKEMACSNPLFKTVNEKAKIITETCEKILSEKNLDLWITEEEQDRLDQQVEEWQLQLKRKAEEIFSVNEQEVKQLKEEIDELRETRVKLRSHASSVSSSITIYPAPTPTDTPSPQDPLTGSQEKAEPVIAKVEPVIAEEAENKQVETEPVETHQQETLTVENDS